MRKIIQADSDGRAYNNHGNLYVEERVQLVQKGSGYGSREEHAATTRSRALKRAREAFGKEAAIRASLSRVHTDRHTRIQYAVVLIK